MNVRLVECEKIWINDLAANGLDPFLVGNKPLDVQCVIVDPKGPAAGRKLYDLGDAQLHKSYMRTVKLAEKFRAARRELIEQGTKASGETLAFLSDPSADAHVNNFVNGVFEGAIGHVPPPADGGGALLPQPAESVSKTVLREWFTSPGQLSAEEFLDLWKKILDELGIDAPDGSLLNDPAWIAAPYAQPSGFEHVVVGDVLSSNFGYHFWFLLHHDSTAPDGNALIHDAWVCQDQHPTPPVANVNFDWYPFGRTYEVNGQPFMFNKAINGFLNGISVEGLLRMGLDAFKTRAAYEQEEIFVAGLSGAEIQFKISGFDGASAIRTFWPACMV